jgi:phage baseplate assembly protein W
MRLACPLLAASLFVTAAFADEQAGQSRVVREPGVVLPQRARPELQNRMLRQRLDTLLPPLMRQAGIDLWLVISREDAEDPVYFSLAPQPAFASRRTTIMVFHDRGEEGVERLVVKPGPHGSLYRSAWEGGGDHWQVLGRLIAARDPKRIGVNISRTWPEADGLTAGLRDLLFESLPAAYRQRVVSAEQLAVRWLETRSPLELEVWPHIVALARGVIAEAFSDRVITPGSTTTDDVAWYIRQRFADLDLAAWFMPYVNVQRPGEPCTRDTAFCGIGGVIHRGDVLHTDAGVCHLGLCTDTQEMGYVLRTGESEAPAGLREALAVGNRWQDLLTAQFRSGRTGNEILTAALAAADRAGIVSSVYSHPLGVFGHAPGPAIGMWDNQKPAPGRGEWPLHPNTGYAIEGNVKVAVPEWEGQLVQIKLEQDAVYDGERVVYLAGRQTQWHVVH